MDLAASIALVLAVLVSGVALRLKWGARGGARSFARVEHDGGSALVGKRTMNAAYEVLEPLVDACVRARVEANSVTWSSLALALTAGGLAAFGHLGGAALALAIASIGDALDGQIARSSGTASARGEVVDAAVDRYSEFAFLGGLAVHYRGAPALLALTLLALLASSMISYASAKAEALAVLVPRGAMRRPERAVILCLGAALVPLATWLAPYRAEGALPLGAVVAGEAPMLVSLLVVAIAGNVSAVRRFRAIDEALATPNEASPRAEREGARITHGAPVIVTEIPGPKSRELRAREDAHVAPGLQGYAVMSGIAVDHARGSIVTDVDGNTFVDLIGGIGVGALGHGHPAVVAAIAEQVQRASVGSFTSRARVELAEHVASRAPSKKLRRLQLYSAGTEAVESALRLAKSHTKKSEFVAFWGGFHGKTMGALSLMSGAFKAGLGPMVPGAHLVPYADCYRCPIGSAYPSCGLGCVEIARKQIARASAGGVAAVVVEPMQGTAGNVVPPDEWLPAIASVAKELDALLVADEMITGFGRTGRYWGVDHSGVEPDILTIGKAFGGGFPLSGVLTTDAIASAAPWSNPSGSSSSYGGNPLAAAAGRAAVRAIDDDDLVERSARVGRKIRDELLAFVDAYPFVGFVDGRGLFLRVELVRDKATKEPLGKRATRRIFDACVQRGLLTMSYAPSFRIQPALTIDEGIADGALAVLREVFDRATEEGWWRD